MNAGPTVTSASAATVVWPCHHLRWERDWENRLDGFWTCRLDILDPCPRHLFPVPRATLARLAWGYIYRLPVTPGRQIMNAGTPSVDGFLGRPIQWNELLIWRPRFFLRLDVAHLTIPFCTKPVGTARRIDYGAERHVSRCLRHLLLPLTSIIVIRMYVR